MAYKYSYDEEEKAYTPPKLMTNRKVWKLIVFSILTLGLYSIAFFIAFSFDLEKASPSRERGKIMNFLWVYLLSLVTFAAVLLVWHYMIAERVEEALQQRHIEFSFDTGTFWGWYVTGSLIIVGPFIYLAKLCKAMNLLCEDYNADPDNIS